MKSDSLGEKANVSLPDAPGAKIVSVYVERKVTVYAIHEPELTTISYLNSAATACFSIGAFFLPFSLQASVFYKDPTAWATCIFFIGGLIATLFRCGIVREIKRQSHSGEN